MTTALLAAVLVRQNPFPPMVALPPEWNVEYFPQNDHSVALLVGPQGERIAFPSYGGVVFTKDASPNGGASGQTFAHLNDVESGRLAAWLHVKDSRAAYIDTWLGGRHVAAALTKDGILVVSLGERKPREHPSDFAVDFATKVVTGRQTAQALAIALTRLTEADRDPLSAQRSRRTPDATAPAALPYLKGAFGRAYLPVGYVYRSSRNKNSPWEDLRARPGRRSRSVKTQVPRRRPTRRMD